VHVVKTNTAISSVSGYDAGQIASVQAQQAALVSALNGAGITARLIDLDSYTPFSGLHYGNGQTLTMGTAVFGPAVVADCTTAGTPITHRPSRRFSVRHFSKITTRRI
jgi:hypothetical protein